MQASVARPFVVDMDSHVMEPPDLWENYLEPQYRERAIRIRKRADGLEELIVDNKVLLAGRLAALGGVDHQAEEIFGSSTLSYRDGCPRAQL